MVLNFCRTLKLSDGVAWRGACCSEHDPCKATPFAVALGSALWFSNPVSYCCKANH